MSAFDAGAKELGRSLADVGQHVGGFGSTLSKVVTGPMTGLMDGLGKLGLAAFGVKTLATALGGVAGGLVSGNAEMETYETQLGTLMGSSELAKKRLAELAKFGAETPFELPEIVRAEKVLLGFGLTGEKALQMTGKSAAGLRTVIGDIAAGTGASFEEIALNFGKFSAGATGEAISRLQEMGVVTREQLTGMGIQFSKAGELMSPLPEAMAAAVQIAQAKFGGGMDKLSKTFAGQMSTLSDNFNQAKIAITAPIFDVLKTALAGVNDFLTTGTFQEGLKQVADLMAGLVRGGIAFVIDAFTRLRPIAEAIVGIITDLVNSGGDMGLFADGLREAFGFDIGAFLGPLQGAVDIAKDNFAAVVAAVEGLVFAAKALFAGDWASAWNIARLTIESFIGWVGPNILTVVGAVVGAVRDAVPPIVTALLAWGQALVDWVAPKVWPLLVEMGRLARALWTWITDTAAPAVLEKLKTWGAQFVAWVQPMVDPMLAEANTLLTALGTWITDTAAPAVLSKLGAWGTQFSDWIGPATDKFLAEWPANLTRFLDWIEKDAAPAIAAQLGTWIRAFTDWIGGAGDESKAAGGMLTTLGNIAGALFTFIAKTAEVLAPRLLTWAGLFLSWVATSVLPFLAVELGKLLVAIGTWLVTDAIPWAGRVFLEFGKAIVAAIIRGILAAPNAIGDALKSLVVPTSLPPSVAGPAPASNYGPDNRWAPVGGSGSMPTVTIRDAGGPIMRGSRYFSGVPEVFTAGASGFMTPTGGMSGGAAGIDYDRLARAMARVPLSVSVDDVHGGLLRKSRRNAGGLGLA